MADRSHCDDLMTFIAASPSPYHVVASAADMLGRAGFRRQREADAYSGATGGHFVVRGGALVAWHVPAGTGPRTPFRIVGAHTDSPNLKIKPSADTSTLGWRQAAVETYGDVPLDSWFDRDLGISGRLALRDGSTRLVCIDRPLLRIPRPAVGPDAGAGGPFRLDPRRHSAPVWGLGGAEDGSLLGRIADESGTDLYEILGWDLMLHDIQPPAYLGDREEFLVASRLDNLVAVHAGITAITDVAALGAVCSAPVAVLVAFDHEEAGGGSGAGVRSRLLEEVLSRSVTARGGAAEDEERALAQSYYVSTSMTHAVNPNQPECHDPDYCPLPNGGPVVKTSANQAYGTDGQGLAMFARICERTGTPWQQFVADGSLSCGTTLGPAVAARLGVPTIDVGVAGLSMHSARELCGADDPLLLTTVLAAFLSAA
ncbi:M18 family aminopeptidase [Streptomyces sp. NPDC051677]|uniref:M18 family aminopeptidase n=1 Tax=Streptomyces sp. NPDC051677 TaxID=3365669 RepID=UPI0037D98E2F